VLSFWVFWVSSKLLLYGMLFPLRELKYVTRFPLRYPGP
jgi:hypothetical protein